MSAFLLRLTEKGGTIVRDLSLETGIGQDFLSKSRSVV